MPHVTRITGVDLVGPDDTRLGTVEHVLFHPSEPRVIGYEIQPVPLWSMIPRRTRFLTLAQTGVAQDGYALITGLRRIPAPQASAKESGLDWDTTVIWLSQRVMTESGRELGYVGDVTYDLSTGVATRVVLTEGATHDVTVGRTKLAGEMLLRFDGAAVVVSDRALEKETSGGVATVAGAGSAVAKEVLSGAAGKAAEAGGKLAAKVSKRWRKSAKEWGEFFGDE